MSENIRFRGRRIYLADEVIVDNVVGYKIYFRVHGYLIFYNFENHRFSDCTCKHGSFWGINDEDKCSHVQACREWIKDHSKGIIKSQRISQSSGSINSFPHKDENNNNPQDTSNPDKQIEIDPIKSAKSGLDLTLREDDGRNNSSKIGEVSVSPIIPETLEAMEVESGDSGESPEPIPFWITKYLDDSKEMRQ